MKRERNSEVESTDQSSVGVAFAAVHKQSDAKIKSDEEKMSLFWRVFGGTILSIAALVGVTIYNNLSGTISELRGEINRINEARGELIKKDEFNQRIATVYERTQNLQTQNNTQNGSLTGLVANVGEMKDRLVTIKSDNDLARKEIAALIDSVKKEWAVAVESIRKDQATINDSLKKDVAAIELMKERIAMITVELKEHRDETTKVRQDVDRNLAGDSERKKNRDDQYAKLLDAIKELDKTVRQTSEKIARLEGALTPTAPPPVTPAKATKPTKTEEKPNGGE